MIGEGCYEGILVKVLEINFWTSAATSSDVLRTVTLHNYCKEVQGF